MLIGKLAAYGFSHKPVDLKLSYLKNRSQRVNVNNTFSSWEEIITGVSQGSTLGPWLFNIFINNVFLFENKAFLSNYTDNNVLYAFGSKHEKIKTHLSITKNLWMVYRKILWFSILMNATTWF